MANVIKRNKLGSSNRVFGIRVPCRVSKILAKKLDNFHFVLVQKLKVGLHGTLSHIDIRRSLNDSEWKIG